MIAACPTCAARYRIDTTKLRPEGARLRCSRCETVFRVRPPAPEAVPEPQAVPEPPAPVQPQEARRPAEAETTSPDAKVPRDRERLVLVAHAEPDVGKAAANALTSWGLDSMLVHDGVEAILNVQRSLPAVVVLDAALPKMFGFQVCELMKRNRELSSIKVVLIGAIHDQGRYRRPPNELYGADAYVERQDLPGGLRPVLHEWGLPVAPDTAPATPRPAPAPAPQATPAPSPPTPSVAHIPAPSAAPAAAPPVEAQSAEVAQAERLARIIVSDIVLYNQEKFDAAVRSGNVVEALAGEMEEGHQLFAQRVDPRIANSQDFLNRELQRLARSRGAG